MENNVVLTDDDIAVLQAALDLSIRSTERYIELNGISSLDMLSREAFEKMKEMYTRFQTDFFES